MKKEENSGTAQRRAAPWLQNLLLFEKRKVGFVTSVFHLVERNEMKGSRINNVASFSGRLWVGEDMAEASVTSPVAHLDSLHLICVVGQLDKEIVRNRFRERRQADFSVELVDGCEQRFASNDIDIDADLLVVPELILKRCL